MAAAKGSGGKVAYFKTAFELFDKDGDGKLTQNELKRAMRSLGMKTNDEEVRDMMSNREFLRFDDFVKVLGKKQKASMKENLEVFGEFDANKDGYISRDELSKAMRKIDKNMSEGEIDNLIRAADKDKDGRINYEEFAEALANDLS